MTKVILILSKIREDILHSHHRAVTRSTGVEWEKKGLYKEGYKINKKKKGQQRQVTACQTSRSHT